MGQVEIDRMDRTLPMWGFGLITLKVGNKEVPRIECFYLRQETSSLDLSH
jgi:hypothetical protein